jgi:hypothetical protein
MADSDRTASLMSPARLAQMKPQAKVTPAAWLDQMAADAGHQHVRRIGELAEVLQEQATSSELSALASQLERLSGALPALDFSLLEPQGWWARKTGKAGGSAEFATRFEQAAQAAQPLASLAAALRQEQQADCAIADRALVELQVESQAVEKIIDQGARWLQDMRTQLKARQAAATDLRTQQQLLEDSARCDILVARLKLLRALCNAAAQVHAQARANADRRLAFAQALEQSVAADVKDWHGRISVLASAASAANGRALGVEGPMERHEELQLTVRKTMATCQEILVAEQSFAGSLALLNQQQAPTA